MSNSDNKYKHDNNNYRLIAHYDENSPEYGRLWHLEDDTLKYRCHTYTDNENLQNTEWRKSRYSMTTGDTFLLVEIIHNIQVLCTCWCCATAPDENSCNLRTENNPALPDILVLMTVLLADLQNIQQIWN